MRGLGLIGVLLALLLVAWLAMRQSTSLTHLAAPPAAGAAPAPAGGNVREQSQQFKQQLENALQTPRDVPDEAK